MTSMTINSDTRQHVDVTGLHSKLTITANGSIQQVYDSADFVVIFENGTGCQIGINGYVFELADNSTGIESHGDGAAVTIGSTGDVTAFNAIQSDGSDVDIINHGRISAISTAIDCAGTGAVVDNAGTITGGFGITVEGTDAVITNEAGGRIDAFGKYRFGIIVDLDAGEKARIVNHGLIASNIEVANGNLTIINDGTLDTTLKLGSGNDYVDLRVGTYLGMDGAVTGGEGDDTLVTDSKKYTLAETDGGGDNDTIKSTVSYTLPFDVETLTLLGKKNINATGNDDTGDANYLYGNAGNNILNGLGGENELYGRGGTDRLIGGASEDIFGIGKGYGRDTAIGFTHGVDKVDVYHVPGVNDYGDLQSDIEKHGSDTWLDFGKNILIIKGVDPTTLDAGDFLFNY